jgi:hypothetical protein
MSLVPIVGGGLAGAQGFVNQRLHDAAPAPSSERRAVNEYRNAMFCDNAFDPDKLLACPVTLRISGPRNLADGAEHGGHEHTGSGNQSGRPLGYLRIDPSGPEGMEVMTNTQNFYRFFSYWWPEFAGTTFVTIDMTMAPGWRCATDCHSPNIARFEFRMQIGLDGKRGPNGEEIRAKLYELPDNPNVYVKCPVTAGCTTLAGTTSNNHVAGMSGTAEMITAVQGLALKYRDSKVNPSRQKLRLSDISTLLGGRYDISGHWGGSHKTHRKGTSLDVSRTTMNANGGIGVTVNQTEIDRLGFANGLSRLRETTQAECPVLQAGEPACMHFDLIE